MYIKKGENYFDDEPLSTLNFLGYQILFSIPILGIIMLLICSFSKEININLRNFARAYLCFILISEITFIIIRLI